MNDINVEKLKNAIVYGCLMVLMGLLFLGSMTGETFNVRNKADSLDLIQDYMITKGLFNQLGVKADYQGDFKELLKRVFDFTIDHRVTLNSDMNESTKEYSVVYSVNEISEDLCLELVKNFKGYSRMKINGARYEGSAPLMTIDVNCDQDVNTVGFFLDD